MWRDKEGRVWEWAREGKKEREKKQVKKVKINRFTRGGVKFEILIPVITFLFEANVLLRINEDDDDDR